MTYARPVSGARFAWIDVAKGFCIVFIVFGHVVHSNMFAAVGGSGAWVELVRAFSPLRIPLFLFVSGYLAHSSMDRPLTASFAKTGGLFLIYIFWETLFHCLQAATQTTASGTPQVGGFPLHLLISILLPATFWYIWALPAYYLLSWGLRRRFGKAAVTASIPLVLIAIVIPFAKIHADGWAHFGETSLGPVLANMIWFHLGLYGRESWHALLARGSAISFGLAALLYASTYLVARLSDADMFVQVILAPIALLMATQCLGWADLGNRLGRLLAAIGRMTLPVYVMHLFGLSLLTKLAGTAPALSAAKAVPMLIQSIGPILATLFLVAICRFGGRMILSSPGRPLLHPMSWPEKGSKPWTRKKHALPALGHGSSDRSSEAV